MIGDYIHFALIIIISSKTQHIPFRDVPAEMFSVVLNNGTSNEKYIKQRCKNWNGKIHPAGRPRGRESWRPCQLCASRARPLVPLMGTGSAVAGLWQCFLILCRGALYGNYERKIKVISPKQMVAIYHLEAKKENRLKSNQLTKVCIWTYVPMAQVLDSVICGSG